MAGRELIVDDDYCKNMGQYFKEQGKQIDELIDKYAEIIRHVRNNALLSGETAGVFNEYLKYVMKMKKQIGELSNTLSNQIDNFLSETDRADSFLY